MLNEHRSKLADADAKAVEAAIADTKKALEGSDVDAINRAAEALTHASHKVAEALYKSGAQPGGGPGGPGANGDVSGTEGAEKTDDVLDAESVDADDPKKV